MMLQGSGKNDSNDKMNDHEKIHLEGLLLLLEQTRQCLGYGTTKEIEILNNIGFICKRTRQFEAAIKYYQECLDLCIKLYGDDSPSTANVYAFMGNTCLYAKNYFASKAYQERSLEIFLKEPQAHSKSLVTCYSALAVATREIGDKQAALEYGKKALELGSQIYSKNNKIQCILLSNYADHLENNHKLEEALTFFNKAIEKAGNLEKAQELNMKIVLWKRIGEIYFLLEDYEQSANSLRESFNLMLETDLHDPDLRIEILFFLIQALIKKGDPKEALNQIDLALDASENNEVGNEILMKIYYEAAKICKECFNSKEMAFNYFEKASSLNFSLNEAELGYFEKIKEMVE